MYRYTFIIAEVITSTTVTTILTEFSNLFLILFFRLVFFFGEKAFNKYLERKKQIKNGASISRKS